MTKTLMAWILAIAMALAIAYNNSQAPAEDLNAVVELASTSAEAQNLMSDALRANPNPSRKELSFIKDRVNEIVVTELARSATGDQSIQTPSERRKAEELKRSNSYKTRLAELSAKPFLKMTPGEFLEFVALNFEKIIVIFLVAMAVAVALRTMRKSSM